ncbi:staphylopine family metallophore export MFS transporter CntE [Paenibacillus oryzisoli]|uniref:Multidrug MFS transporter n=1 Tax=Paenibacillus oryzisoli TaxID=1850517 RepID=A0A198A192_9BACL|nr:MFS transporter [Paenibacillus oryzisoli]OAS14872.1 multidrug MFS transporter [Paenibacillus oryzisoli]
MTGALSWPFVRLYILALLFFSANAILNVLIPLRGESLGASNTAIGLIMGAYMCTAMIFRPWAGVIIKQQGPIKVLRILLVVNGLALLLYAFSTLEGFLIARILQGCSTAFFSMALQIGIIDALPEKERSQGISLYSLFTYMPGILGPVLAIGIWQAGGMSYFTILLVAIAIVTGVFGYSIPMETEREQPAEKQRESELQLGVLQSFSQLVKNPYLFKSSVLMLTASTVFGAITNFLPLYATQLKHGSAGIYLMIQAGFVVAARFALRKKIPSDGIWHTYFMMGIMLILAVAVQCVSYSLEGGIVFFYGGAVLMGLAQALLYPVLTTYLSFVLPQMTRNALLGLFVAMADLGMSLGGVLMGPIADATSYSTMYMICAMMSAGMIIFAYEKQSKIARQIDN